MDEPAWTAGIPNSANPAIGPDAINLMSFAIFPISNAKFLNAPDAFAWTIFPDEFCVELDELVWY